MKRAKAITSLLLTLVLLFNMVPIASAAGPDVTLTAVPNVTSVDKGSGTAEVVYTISLSPQNDTKLTAFEFTLSAPDGMVLKDTKSAKGGSGYWINATELLYVENFDDPALDKGIFVGFSYYPASGNMAAYGGLSNRSLSSTKDIMTIAATIDISAAKTYELGFDNVFFKKDGSDASIPMSDYVVDVTSVSVVDNSITKIDVLDLDAPATGATPDTRVTISATPGGIVTAVTNWYEGSAAADDKLIDDTANYKFKGESVYTVRLTLTAEEYPFASDVTIPEGYTVQSKSDKQIILTKTFAETAPANVTSLSISGATSANVPSKAEGEATVALTATATHSDSQTSDKTSAATWTLGDTYDGVSIDKGVVTIAPNASAGTVTVKAMYNGKEATHEITLSKESSVLTTLEISAQPSDPKVPYLNHTTKVTLTAKGYDQYGAATGTVNPTWAFSSESAPTGMSINGNVLTIAPTAAAGTVTVKATSAGVEASKTITVTKEAPKPTTITVSNGVSTMAVPAIDTLGTANTATADTAFTAEVKDQYGEVYNMTGMTIDWTIDGAYDGVSIENGYLKVTNKAQAATDVKVKATVTGTEVSDISTAIKITKAAQAVSFVKLNKNTDRITIPTAGKVPCVVTYTATTYDQYGNEYTTGTTAWSATDMPDGVMQNGATISVPARADEGTFTLTATNNNVSDSVNITVQKKPLHKLSGTFENKTYTYDGATVTQAVTCTTDGTVEYTSSNPDVVAVNSTTGELTIHKVGEATITASVEETAAYAPASMSYTVTVNPKPLTITGVSATTRAYAPNNTNVALLGGDLQGVKSGDDVSFTLGNGTIASANAGMQNVSTSIALTGADMDNYTLIQPTGITVVITKAENPITGLSCADVTFGTAPVPTGATAINGRVAYRYSANENGMYSDWNTANAVGEYWVEAYVAESDNYKAGSTKLSFHVIAKSLNDATFAAIESAPYSGSAITPKPAVTLDGKVLLEGTDFEYSYADNTYVGRASVNVIGKGNYSGSADTAVAFSINSAANPAVINTGATVKMGGNTVDLSKNISGAMGNVSYAITSGEGTVDEKGIFTSPETSGTATVEVTVEAKDMNDDGINEYTGKTETITVTITKKDNAPLTVDQTGCTYGEKLADPTFTTPDGKFVSKEVLYSGTNYAESTVKPTNAGSYTVKVVYETKTTIYTGTKTFSIAPKALSNDMILAIPSVTYTGEAITPEPAVAYGSKLLVKDTDFTYSYADNTDAGTAKVTVTAVANGNYSGSAEQTFIINAKPISITGATAVARTYNGEKGVEVSAVTFDDAALIKNTDYTVVGVMSDANAGEAKTANVTVALTNPNYSLATVTTTTTVKISKATAQDIPNQNVKLFFSNNDEQTLSLAGLLPDDAGANTYAKGTEDKTGAVTVDSWSVSSEGLVSYKLNGGAVGDTVTLPVTISSTNYLDKEVNVVVTLTDKSVPVLDASDITAVYTGEALTSESIPGTATYDGVEIPGTWSFASAAPANVNESSNAVIVVFTPDDTDAYETVEATIKVIINKAKPTGTPAYTKITTSGKTLADANLSVGTITPEGTIQWEADSSTSVEKNKAYSWTFIPTDADNYESLHGEITVWSQSGFSGGYYPGSFGDSTTDEPESVKPAVKPVETPEEPAEDEAPAETETPDETPADTPAQPDVTPDNEEPADADTSSPVIWIVFGAAALLALIFIVVVLAKRRNRD